VVNRLVPIFGIEAMALPKYRLSRSKCLKWRQYKYPNPNCTNWFLHFFTALYSFVQFGWSGV